MLLPGQLGASSIRRRIHLGTRQSRRPAKRMRTPELVQLVAPADEQVVGDDPQEETDLVGRAPPVLGREGIDGEPFDPELDRSLGRVEQRLLAGPVALGARQAPLGRPAAVAVHDAGHVAWDAVRVKAV